MTLLRNLEVVDENKDRKVIMEIMEVLSRHQLSYAYAFHCLAKAQEALEYKQSKLTVALSKNSD